VANCKHLKCKEYTICGQISGKDKKNPGGNIYTPGQVYKHKTHKVLGWHSADESLFYNQLVGSLTNGIIVEVGVFGGASLLGVIDSCKKTNSHIYGIDPWEKIIVANGVQMLKEQQIIYRERIQKIRLNLESIIKQEGYDKNVTLIHDFATNATHQFDNESVDVAFIDGDHAYDAVYEDMKIWLPKIKIGGTMWGDDFGGWESVRTAVQDFCKNNNIKLQKICGGRAWAIIK
jgi:predicted O-methyltransferase YrrM